MIFFYLAIAFFILIGMKYSKGTFNTDYISVEQTNVIKGIFIWLVFIGHIMPYVYNIVPFDSFVDKAGLGIVGYLKQLVVVPFLFYSGYGVMNSIKNKGTNYVNAIPKKRILVTMLNFSVAVSFYVLLNLLLNIPMDLKQVLLSYVCWDSVGNSNWYILTICFCYLSSYISYKFCGYSRKYLILNLFILTIYVLVLSRFKGSWWYDTCLAYAAGSIFCFYKDKFDIHIRRKYPVCLIGVCVALILSYIAVLKTPIASYLLMNVCSIFFSIVLLLFTMKFKLKSKVLEWSGQNLFPLYIYQRIPMILLSTIAGGSLVVNHRYLYVIVCAIVSILIVRVYKYINIKL